MWWLSAKSLPLSEKIRQLNIGLILVVLAISGIGYMALTSAGGAPEVYADRHFIRLVIGLCGMMLVSVIDIRFWRQVAWPFYGACLLLLIFVELKGHVGMGAQRWLNLGVIRLQPSEVMKIALILVLSDYYAKLSVDEIRHVKSLILPAIITALPTLLVLMQPDLGTALKLGVIAAVITFLAGTHWLVYIGGAVLGAAAVPLGWFYVLKPYQKQRILTFLDPASDPLGSGYHVTQSKIALGSGGVGGKGYMEGTQSQLNFLPEKQTDFIFTLWAEEWGLVGGVVILALFAMVLFYAIIISMKARHTFPRLLSLGLGMNIMLYVFINTGMVMGLLPVVGVPLPLISYGGTVILTTCFALGLIQSAAIHRDMKMGRFS